MAISLFVLVAVAFLGAVTASDVVVLTPDNFDSEVGKEKDAFVEFYAPWCGHCKKLAPEYDQVGTAFKKLKSVVVVGKVMSSYVEYLSHFKGLEPQVDCDDHKDLCGRFDIKGFPTLKFFPKGSLKPLAYESGRTADAIVEYINKEAGTSAGLGVSGPSDVVILTPDNIDDVVKDEGKFVLAEFYAPWCGHCKTLAPIYEELATAFKAEKDVVIAKCDADAHSDLGSRFDVSGFPTLKYFVKGSTEAQDFEGDRTLDQLLDFVNENAGTFRAEDGSLNDKAGKIAELDVLAQEYTAAQGEERAEVLKKAVEAAEKITDNQYAAQYLKVFKNFEAKGEDFPTKETSRLERMRAGKVSPAKKDEFQVRLNILSSFADGASTS